MGLYGIERILIPGTDRVDYDDPDVVRSYLKDFEAKYLLTTSDCEEYINLLAGFRRHIEKWTAQYGKNFLSTIRNLLSVGTDGVYTNNLRFLFELIQNVDDCDYAPGAQPQLTINFDNANNKLIFRYNELGFDPRNVFSITGIAEEAKNLDEKKIQIGEKGIGFKSVFGVASRVLIRSGLFSFRLNRDSFTIPVPEYSDGFNGIDGTELTLEFDSAVSLSKVMNSVMERYRKDDALFTQNPIVFLNKLNGLEFKCGDDLLLSFSVRRTNIEEIDSVKRLSVIRGMELSSRCKGRPDRAIHGTCYIKAVEYSKTDCQSRYGEETLLESRELDVKAFFPDESFVAGENGRGSIEKGLFYSFLPTQITINAPIICHAPFKLDASREFVDSQGKNAWFRRTITAFSALMHSCYRLHAQEVREKIIAYLPESRGLLRNFFSSDSRNAKMNDLLDLEYNLNGLSFSRDKIFYCHDGNFYAANEVVSFYKCEDIDNPLKILRFVGNYKPFFCAPKGYDPSRYSVPVLQDPYEELFNKVFSCRDISLDDANIALNIIQRKSPNLINDKCRSAEFLRATVLNPSHLLALAKVGELRTLVDVLIRRIKSGTYFATGLSFSCNSGGRVTKLEKLLDVDASSSYEGMGRWAQTYFRSISDKLFIIENSEGCEFCAPATSICVIAGQDPVASVIEFCRKLDPDSLFSVRLKLKNASAKLDAAMTTDKPREFLRELRNIRIASKEAMGERAYGSYLDLIQNSGTSTGRYVNELLQNADDCEYAEGAVPMVEITSENGTLSVTSNEIGFKANNVRAITAIGESTKNLVLDNHVGQLTIGEKGVGFKSVFAIADSVEIHSGGFDFALHADSPTVPELLPETSNQVGTCMRFDLKKDFAVHQISEPNVLDLCVCLRNLKEIKLFGHSVKIEDNGNISRLVTIDETIYNFLICEHEFEIADALAVALRNAGGKTVSPHQKIRCYVPVEINRDRYPLYCGLPLKVDTCAPIIIDAPFELTTSRDAVLEDRKWNECVRDNVYTAILKTAKLIKAELRINILHLFGIERAVQSNGRLVYSAKMFSGVCGAFLNGVTNFIDRIRRAEIIPVKRNANVFLCPDDESLRIFPPFLSAAYDSVGGIECPFERVDFDNGMDVAHLRQVLEALTVKRLDESEFWMSVEHLGVLPELMANDEFRDGVYGFLRKLGDVHEAGSRAIIPVVMEDGVRFVCENSGRFFYSEEDRISTEKYYIVDTDRMDRETYEKVFGEELKEMNAAQEREFYCTTVCQYILCHDICDRYNFLLRELNGVNSENLQLCMPNIRHVCKNMLPLKNRNGEILCGRMFVGMNGAPLMRGRLLKTITIDPECATLAALLETPLLSQLCYRDIPDDPWEITRDDILDIKGGNISDKDNILLLAVQYGRIAAELAIEFKLTAGLVTDVHDDFEFPTDPLRDPQALKLHIRECLNNPTRIVSKQVEQPVDYCVASNGNEFRLNSREARQSALRRYAPSGHEELCFCQMCQRAKRIGFVEVNCIEKTPKLYFPELRLTLCLECSKKFELLRNDDNFYNRFIDGLTLLNASNNYENVRLRLPLTGRDTFELLFTRTHLAEIQEILRGKRFVR